MSKRERTMVCGWIDAEPEYIRKDVADAMLKAEREKVLREVMSTIEVIPPDHFDEGTSAAFEAILALLSEDKTDE